MTWGLRTGEVRGGFAGRRMTAGLVEGVQQTLHLVPQLRGLPAHASSRYAADGARLDLQGPAEGGFNVRLHVAHGTALG